MTSDCSPCLYTSCYKFPKKLASSIVAPHIVLPPGTYWNMNSDQEIIGIYIDRGLSQANVYEVGEDVEKQIKECIKTTRVKKTPDYTLRAQKAYYERKKASDPDFLAKIRERDKRAKERRQRLLVESETDSSSSSASI
jgi:hypothetical protein